MGANTPKSIRDHEYRRMVAKFLEELMADRDMKVRELAKAMGVDRSVASRYLSQAVRAPIHRLQNLQRNGVAEVPAAIEDAFWRAESEPTGAVVDVENYIRDVGHQIMKRAKDGESRAKAKSTLEDLIRKLG